MDNQHRVAWAPTDYHPTELGVKSSGGHFVDGNFETERQAKNVAAKLNVETCGSIGRYYVIYK